MVTMGYFTSVQTAGSHLYFEVRSSIISEAMTNAYNTYSVNFLMNIDIAFECLHLR